MRKGRGGTEQRKVRANDSEQKGRSGKEKEAWRTETATSCPMPFGTARVFLGFLSSVVLKGGVTWRSLLVKQDYIFVIGEIGGRFRQERVPVR